MWGYTYLTGAVGCEFDLLSNKWAWVDESNQYWGSKNYQESTNVADSELNLKKTKAYCRNIDTYNVQLNNGRECSNPWQCKSLKCEEGICQGLKQGEYCHEHDDCSEQ